MTRSLRMALGTALVAVLLISTGCFNSAQQEQTAVTTEAMPPATRDAAAPEGYSMADQKAAGGSAGGSDAVAQGDRLVVRNASIAMQVDDIDETIEQIKAAVASNSAEVADLQLNAGSGPVPLADGTTAPSGPANATVTIRVPAAKLDALSRQLSSLGEVTSQGESASDVTEQAIDMEARLTNLRAQEAQLRKFFEKATKVSDLLAIEQELARVRGEIESMDAQLTYLKRQAARATLVVSVTEPAPVVSPAGADWGITDAVRRGVQGAALVVTTAITLAIALVPLALVIAAVWLVVRRARRRRAERTTDADRTDAVSD